MHVMTIRIVAFNGKDTTEEDYKDYITNHGLFRTNIRHLAQVIGQLERLEGAGVQLIRETSNPKELKDNDKTKRGYNNPWQYEIGQYRITFDYFWQEKTAWLLHAFLKKRQKEQRKDIVETFKLQKKLRELKKNENQKNFRRGIKR